MENKIKILHIKIISSLQFIAVGLLWNSNLVGKPSKKRNIHIVYVIMISNKT